MASSVDSEDSSSVLTTSTISVSSDQDTTNFTENTQKDSGSKDIEIISDAPLFPVIVTYGGKEFAKSVTNNVWAISCDESFNNRIISLPSLPKALFHAPGLTYRNKLYVVGGRAGDGLFGTSLACWSYDPVSNKWLEISALNRVRHGHCCVLVGDELIVLGGKDKEGENSTLEVLDLKSGSKWDKASDLPFQVYDAAAVSLKNAIFLTGGFLAGSVPMTKRKQMHSIFKRKEEVEGVVAATWVCKWPSRSWKRLSDMNYARERHGMVTSGGKVYVVGGVVRIGDDWDDLEEGPRRHIDIPEVYNPKTDQWTILSQMPLGQSSMSAVVHDGKIYTIGGYSFQRKSAQDFIQVYTIETDTWERLDETLNSPVCLNNGTILHLPAPMFNEKK